MARTLVHLILRLIHAIDPAMEVESGLNCSCPITMQHAADNVVDRAESILRELDVAPHGNREEILSQAKAILGGSRLGSQGGCREFVRSRAAVDLLYFNSISTVSDAVVDYIEGLPTAFTKLSEVIEDLSVNERLLKGDVYKVSYAVIVSDSRAYSRLEIACTSISPTSSTAIRLPFPWADPSILWTAAKKWLEKGRVGVRWSDGVGRGS